MCVHQEFYQYPHHKKTPYYHNLFSNGRSGKLGTHPKRNQTARKNARTAFPTFYLFSQRYVGQHYRWPQYFCKLSTVIWSLLIKTHMYFEKVSILFFHGSLHIVVWNYSSSLFKMLSHNWYREQVAHQFSLSWLNDLNNNKHWNLRIPFSNI